jgi:hypothetical protein
MATRQCFDLEMGNQVGDGTTTSSGHTQNEIIETSLCAGVVAIGGQGGETLRSRHEYEELENDPTTTTLRRNHDYEDPDTRDPTAQVPKAFEYEEPVASGWKRLSMPCLETASAVPLPQMLRRNMSAVELSSHAGRKSKKPAKILHYAEFSLYPSSGDAPQVPTTTTTSRVPHEYEEPPFAAAYRHHPLCLGPIPPPARFLHGVSDYEVPLDMPVVKRSTGQSSIKSKSVMRQVKLKLDRWSQSLSGNSKEEDDERLLLSVESDPTPDQLKSPGINNMPSPGNDQLKSPVRDMPSENGTCFSQEVSLSVTYPKSSHRNLY